MGTEIATQHAAAIDIRKDDVDTPSLKIVQKGSAYFDAELAKQGDMAIGYGKEDEDPEIVFESSDVNAKPVQVRPLALRRFVSVKVDGGRDRWPEGHPDAPEGAMPAYEYAFIMEDGSIARMYFDSSAAAVGRKINRMVSDHQEAGNPPYTLAIGLTTKRRTGQQDGKTFTWFVPVLHTMEPDAKYDAVCAKVAASFDHTPRAQQVHAEVVL